MRLLTRAGWGVLLAGGVALLCGWLFGLPELLILGLSLLVLLVGAGATTMFTSLRLEVVRSLHPDRVHAGSASRVEVLVRNRGRRRTPVLTLRDGVSGTAGAELFLAPLERNGRIRAAYRLPTRRRGVITVGPLEVELGDPFGLTQVAVIAAPASTLVVYPAVDDVAAASRSDGMDPHGWRTPGLQTGGDEFHSLRPYVIGDDLRRVHWASTARRDELTVRQDERHQQGRTTVLLDVRRAVHTDESFERAVSAAASLLVAAVRRGDEVRLVATDGTDSGYGAGPTSVSAMLEYLAAVVTTDRGDEVRVDHPGTLVALTTPAGVSTTGSASGPGRRFLVVFERSPGDGAGAIAGPSTIRVAVDESFAAAWGADAASSVLRSPA
ncbi:MAG: DUF58 domain-containing protein [Acidimicrobiales bacterium]